MQEISHHMKKGTQKKRLYGNIFASAQQEEVREIHSDKRKRDLCKISTGNFYCECFCKVALVDDEGYPYRVKNKRTAIESDKKNESYRINTISFNMRN